MKNTVSRRKLIQEKKIIIILAVLFCILFARIYYKTAQSQPPLIPSSFYGTVTVNDQFVPVGTMIYATMGPDDEIAASTEVFLDEDEKSVYFIKIPGGASFEGELITFYIGDNLADQTAYWHSGVNQLLNLSADEVEKGFQIYLPLILH